MKNERFAQAIVAGKNQTQAAISAGYSKDRARITGSELMGQGNVKREIVSIFDRIGLTDKKLARIHKQGLTKSMILKDGKELPDHRIRLGYLRLAHELRGNIQELTITQNVVQVTPQQAKSKLDERLGAIEKAQNREDLTHKDHPPEKAVVSS